MRIIQIRKAGSYQVQNTITDRVSTSVCFVLFMPEDYLTAKTLSVHYHMDSMHISCFSNLMNINPKRTNSVLPHQRDSRAVETTVLLVSSSATLRPDTCLFFLLGRSRRRSRAVFPAPRFSVPSQIWVYIFSLHRDRHIGYQPCSGERFSDFLRA